MITIRPFHKPDWPAVKAIYQQGIDTKNATFQVKAKAWPEWDSSLLNQCRLVATLDGTVVGWAALSAVSRRAVYAGVAEVSIYISTAHQGLGVGKKLLLSLITESENAGIWTLQAGIFPENKASVTLHQKCGFKVVGRREKIGKLDNTWRDVLLMERRSAVAGV